VKNWVTVREHVPKGGVRYRKMQVETMEAEIGEIEKILGKRRGAVKPSGLGSLPLVLTIMGLLGVQASAFTAYDCSNRSNVIESYLLLEPDACANLGRKAKWRPLYMGRLCNSSRIE
jgi:hypothetical protein